MLSWLEAAAIHLDALFAVAHLDDTLCGDHVFGEVTSERQVSRT